MNIEFHELLRYLVTSESNPRKKYLVDLLTGECSCIDHGVRKHECKHLRAAKLYWAENTLCEIRNKTKVGKT